MTKEEMKEMLDIFQESVNKQFENVNEQFKKIDERFDKIDERFEKIDARFEQIDERFEKIDRSLDSVQEEVKLTRRESGVMFEYIVHELIPPIAEGVAEIPKLREAVSKVEEKVDGLDNKVTALTFYVQNNLEPRVVALENK